MMGEAKGGGGGGGGVGGWQPGKDCAFAKGAPRSSREGT